MAETIGLRDEQADLQQVAYLGPPGTYSEEAAIQHSGADALYIPYASIDQAVVAAERNKADIAVVPLENSTEGSVTRTLDILLGTSLRACGEVMMPIRHQLMGRLGCIEEVRVVAAHPQALAQCRNWLDANIPGAERFPMASNAQAAAESLETSGMAAIAGRRAANIYGLDILAFDIEDEPDNTTRFMVLGKAETEPTGCDKTSIICSVPNQAGSLYRVLGALSNGGINMTKIESRPNRGSTWEYNFYIDLEGHERDPVVEVALTEMRATTSFMKVVGSYSKDCKVAE